MDTSKVGARIRQLRTQKAWTQEELASIAAVSSRTIQRAEEGQMSADTLRAVASALGIPVEELNEAGEQRQPTMSPVLYYEHAETLDWLVDVFGMKTRMLIPDAEGRVVHAELYLDDARIIIGQPVVARNWTTPKLSGVNTQSLFVVVENVDKHYQHAKEKGAEILLEPEDMHGDRRYLVADPEGHHWWFLTSVENL
ncbi:MAG: helix-turn-helix domain-containing protein [Gammaproteobacteria bacterium]|nr:helix-turn-helix domain-containing protein [Gammaproteobacteria bacterium]